MSMSELDEALQKIGKAVGELNLAIVEVYKLKGRCQVKGASDRLHGGLYPGTEFVSVSTTFVAGDDPQTGESFTPFSDRIG